MNRWLNIIKKPADKNNERLFQLLELVKDILASYKHLVQVDYKYQVSMNINADIANFSSNTTSVIVINDGNNNQNKVLKRIQQETYDKRLLQSLIDILNNEFEEKERKFIIYKYFKSCKREDICSIFSLNKHKYYSFIQYIENRLIESYGLDLYNQYGEIII